MNELMLVNPRKRSRSAAQKAATRRMIAARGGKRHSNPKRRRVYHAAAKRRHNPIHRVYRRKRNPMSLGAHGITGMLLAGLKGAGGAVAVNVVCGFLPAALIPASVAGQTNYQLYAVRTALAIALGTVGRKALGASAREMAVGALTVNFHDFLNSVVGTTLPGSTLRGVGMNIRNALPGAGNGQVFDQELAGMGEYLYR
jgi:hypothetical protein